MPGISISSDFVGTPRHRTLILGKPQRQTLAIALWFLHIFDRDDAKRLSLIFKDSGTASL
jgi:hypothetical protein